MRATCERVVADFRDPRLRVIDLPDRSRLAIEFDGCRGALAPVLMVLVALGALAGAETDLDPCCPRCTDPNSCREPPDELLNTCHPALLAIIDQSIDRICEVEGEA